ncbi:MAG: universal stress protein [Proteobacteria bacterium]|nr:universal stress protein [Pseudomonadota bacterium]
MNKRVGFLFNEVIHSEIAFHYAFVFAKSSKSELFIFIDRNVLKSEQYYKQLNRFIKECKNSSINAHIIEEDSLDLHSINKKINSLNINILFLPISLEVINNTKKLIHFIEEIKNKINKQVALIKPIHLAKLHHSKILLLLNEKTTNLNQWSELVYLISSYSDSKVVLLYLTQNNAPHKLPKNLEKLFEILSELNINVDWSIEQGITGKKVNLEAALKRYDLIIMGFSKRSLLKTLMKGNIMFEILKEAPCNILIYKT